MNLTLLIVDDSRILRASMKRAVIQAGIEEDRVFEAENGEVALQVARDEDIDIVLLDLNMPVMDGAAFVKEVRADPVLKDLTVVLVTTEANEERLDRLEVLGVQGYLHKPFEPEQLRMLVRDLLGTAQ